jgi:hypothetical protein
LRDAEGEGLPERVGDTVDVGEGGADVDGDGVSVAVLDTVPAAELEGDRVELGVRLGDSLTDGVDVSEGLGVRDSVGLPVTEGSTLPEMRVEEEGVRLGDTVGLRLREGVRDTVGLGLLVPDRDPEDVGVRVALPVAEGGALPELVGDAGGDVEGVAGLVDTVGVVDPVTLRVGVRLREALGVIPVHAPNWGWHPVPQ